LVSAHWNLINIKSGRRRWQIIGPQRYVAAQRYFLGYLKGLATVGLDKDQASAVMREGYVQQ
jgi:hypothetical protein